MKLEKLLYTEHGSITWKAKTRKTPRTDYYTGESLQTSPLAGQREILKDKKRERKARKKVAS